MLGAAGVGFQRLRSRSAASPMLSIVREIARGALLGQVGGVVGVGDIFFGGLFWSWVGWGKRREEVVMEMEICVFSCVVLRWRFFLKAAVLLDCCCVIISVKYLSPFVRSDIFFFRLSQSPPHHHHHNHDNAMEQLSCLNSVTEIFEARRCH